MADAVHVVCPQCDTVNRVPKDKLTPDHTGKCGQCGGPLFEGHPVELDSARFPKHAQNSGVPILVDFWAPWCGPCRMMGPNFAKAAEQLEPRARFVKVNTDESPEVASAFGIMSIPTLVLLRDGQEVARKVGVMDSAMIERWLDQHA